MTSHADTTFIEYQLGLMFPNNAIYVRSSNDGYLMFVANNNAPTVFRSISVDSSVLSYSGTMEALSVAAAQLIEQQDPDICVGRT